MPPRSRGTGDAKETLLPHRLNALPGEGRAFVELPGHRSDPFQGEVPHP